MAIKSINQDICTGCGTCVNSCEYDVLRMDEEIKKPRIAYPDDCTVCSRCQKDCPVGAIELVPGIKIHATTFFGF